MTYYIQIFFNQKIIKDFTLEHNNTYVYIDQYNTVVTNIQSLLRDNGINSGRCRYDIYILNSIQVLSDLKILSISKNKRQLQIQYNNDQLNTISQLQSNILDETINTHYLIIGSLFRNQK